LGTSTYKEYYRTKLREAGIDLIEIQTVNHYLAMRITRYRELRTIGIDQEIYIDHMLKTV